MWTAEQKADANRATSAEDVARRLKVSVCRYIIFYIQPTLAFELMFMYICT